MVKDLIQAFEPPTGSHTSTTTPSMDQTTISTSTSSDKEIQNAQENSPSPTLKLPEKTPILTTTTPVLKTSSLQKKDVVDLTDSSNKKKTTFEEQILDEDFHNSSSNKKFSGKSFWRKHVTYCSLMFTIPANVEDKLSNVKWVIRQILTTITAADSTFRILPFEGVYEHRDNLIKIFEPFLTSTSELPSSSIQI